MWLRKKKQNIYESLLIILLVVLVTISIVIVLILVVSRNDDIIENEDIVPQTPVVAAPDQEQLVGDQGSHDLVGPEPDPLFDKIQLQSLLEQWKAGVPGSASVVVMTVAGDEMASINKDQQYFAASIYKLYVAYFGYRQVDAGEVNPDEIYINGHTRAECLNLMIRESDSPCAEKWRAELGSTYPNDTADIADTAAKAAIVDLQVNALDTASLLKLIANSDGLSQQSHDALLASMQTQIYRDALNKGFSSTMTVYNKIGFRDFDEYHDVAIIELVNGRQFILCVLTNGVGTRNIVSLGSQIEAIIK